MRSLGFIAVLFFCQTIFAERVSENIVSVYATFQKKSTHDNITINYIGTQKSETAPVLYVSKTPGIDPDHIDTRHEEGIRIDLPKVDSAFVYTTEIDNLEPATKYYFVTGDELNGYSPEMSFKTLPIDDRPIVLLQGGDMGSDSDISIVPQTALLNKPDAILIGGDIAYVDGEADKFYRWLSWFQFMNEVMVDEKLHLTPMIVAIGNHETKGIFGSKKSKVPYYYRLFPQNGNRAYFSRKPGANNILIVLDTVHGDNPGGSQKSWMKKELKAEIETPNKLALYHIPLYPGHRSFNTFPSQLMRNTWRKYFDRYGLAVAFENHDHVYKRTFMLKDNEIVDSNGTVYVGDGCWGRKTRTTEERWYLKASLPGQHVWSAILENDRISLQATGKDGYLFDEFHIDMTGDRVVVETEWFLRGMPREAQELLSLKN